MKPYTTIQNAIASKLSAADTYRYTCLSFTPRKNGYTDSTFKQIAELNSNEPEPERTIQHFVERLKDSQVMKIEEVFSEGKRRNRYYFPETEKNFKMISSKLLQAEIPVELKGFMIQLFTITINNTYDINLSLNKIVDQIKISKPTAQKYLKQLQELELITKTETGYTLTGEYFLLGDVRQNLIDTITDEATGTDLEPVYRNTNWTAIKYPIAYKRSVEGGYRFKKQKRKLVAVDSEI